MFFFFFYYENIKVRPSSVKLHAVYNNCVTINAFDNAYNSFCGVIIATIGGVGAIRSGQGYRLPRTSEFRTFSYHDDDTAMLLMWQDFSTITVCGMFIIIDMDKNVLDCNWLKIGYEKIKIIVKRYDNDINFFIPLFYKIVSYNCCCFIS